MLYQYNSWIEFSSNDYTFYLSIEQSPNNYKLMYINDLNPYVPYYSSSCHCKQHSLDFKLIGRLV